MKIYREINLNEFEFWSGAKSTVELLEKDELEQIQEYLEELEADGHIWSETELNDFFWFDNEWIANFLGFDSFDALIAERRYNK